MDRAAFYRVGYCQVSQMERGGSREFWVCDGDFKAVEWDHGVKVGKEGSEDMSWVLNSVPVLESG